VATSAPPCLAPLTTLRVGGPAARLLEPPDEATLTEAVRELDAAGEPVLVLGGGSNVVIADAGFAGTVVHVVSRGIRETSGDRVVVQAGEPWEPLVDRTVAEGRRGFESLAGIPGSTGATPIQNVGAYGHEVGEVVESVRVLDRATGRVEEVPRAACGFGYRTSAFKGSDRRLVLAVTFRLEHAGASAPVRYGELARALGIEVGESAPLPAVRDAVLALRRAKGMVVDPADPDSVSAGSFFTNPVLDPGAFAALQGRVRARLGDDARLPAFPEPDGRVKTSAAWLIQNAGFARGHRRGGAAISAKHTLALVNRGGATAAELVALAREIAAGVREAFGVALVPEPVFVGHAW
jgi:UDP-N-acetylmuramate dehydrogenase